MRDYDLDALYVTDLRPVIVVADAVATPDLFDGRLGRACDVYDLTEARYLGAVVIDEPTTSIADLSPELEIALSRGDDAGHVVLMRAAVYDRYVAEYEAKPVGADMTITEAVALAVHERLEDMPAEALPPALADLIGHVDAGNRSVYVGGLGVVTERNEG